MKLGTALATALLLSLAAPSAAGAMPRSPHAEAPRRSSAGSLDVPLDQSGRVPGTLRLHVERIPARARSAAPCSCSRAAQAGA